MDHLEDDAEAPLSDLERRLGRWRPAPGSLDRDRMLYEAGRASARAESWGRLGAALAACFAVVAVGLGALLVRERAHRQTLEVALAERSREPAPPELGPSPSLLPAAEPAPDSYLALTHRLATVGLEQPETPPTRPVHDQFPVISGQSLTPLRARSPGNLLDL